MNRSTRPHRISVAILLLILLAGGLNAAASAVHAGRILSIEPAATWVGIARVYLEIEDLQQVGERLEGTYRIRVPLAPGQNDTGRVRLQATGPLDELGDNEATVVGNALSTTGQVHDVVARMQRNGVVRIDVTTPVRVLHFKSRYASR